MILFNTPTSTPSLFLANVSDALADPGLLAILAVAVALPLTFWVIEKIIEMMPRNISQRETDLEADLYSTEKRIRNSRKYLNEETNFIRDFGKIGEK